MIFLVQLRVLEA